MAKIQLYARGLGTETKASVEVGQLEGLLGIIGVRPDVYNCLCKQGGEYFRLEEVAILNPCHEKDCNEKLKEAFEQNKETLFYVDAISTPELPEKIGKFPNVTYIMENTSEEVLDDLIEILESHSVS